MPDQDDVLATMCPGCHGDGEHDHRDLDSWFGEHYSDEGLDWLRSQGMVHPVGIVQCDECEGTGIVTRERRLEMLADAHEKVMAIIERAEAIDQLEKALLLDP